MKKDRIPAPLKGPEPSGVEPSVSGVVGGCIVVVMTRYSQTVN